MTTCGNNNDSLPWKAKSLGEIQICPRHFPLGHCWFRTSGASFFLSVWLSLVLNVVSYYSNYDVYLDIYIWHETTCFSMLAWTFVLADTSKKRSSQKSSSSMYCTQRASCFFSEKRWRRELTNIQWYIHGVYTWDEKCDVCNIQHLVMANLVRNPGLASYKRNLFVFILLFLTDNLVECISWKIISFTLTQPL